MGLFRRSALTAIGGWNEWCICEDTEASLRVLRDGWSGLYIPRCFGRGIVPPSFAGMLTQRHRWCYGAMQILRLHWRSLMPWDRSPDNHLTAAQRRDYLMASVGWFRDLLMLAFSFLLVAITALSVTHSGFYVAPMDGARSLLPLSLIVIASVCLMYTLRFWTTLSYRRAFLSLVISLSVAFVIARGCIEGVARRNGVFLRTSKAGGRNTIFTALKLTRWETALAAALYTCAGLLAAARHPSWLLIFIIVVQASVYLCGPVVAVWNLRAQTAPGRARQHAFTVRRGRGAARRRRPAWAWVPRPATAALTALCVGGVTSAFVAPVALLHATTAARGAVSAQSLLGSAGTQVYLELGSSGTGRAYYPVTPVRLADLAAAAPGGAAHVGFSFDTSSLVLLGSVLAAAADGGRISRVSLAFRTPGPDGRFATELVDTFGGGTVASVAEHLSGTPAGRVALLLPAASEVASTPGTLQHAGPFAALGAAPGGSAAAAAAKSYVSLGGGAPSYAVTAVSLSQAASGAAVRLTFTTSALPLLSGIFQAEGDGAPIRLLTLSVRGGPVLSHTFSGLKVSSFAETLSGAVSGTATLVVRPR